MRLFRRLARRARVWLQPGATDRDIRAELESHLAFEIEARVAEGCSREQAEREARHAFGAVERMHEEARDAKGVGAVRDAVGDMRYGLRALRRAPAFAVIAIVTLAIGIGANTALFSVVYGVLVRALPFPHPDALVTVWDGGHSRAEFAGIREAQRSFTAIGAYYPSASASLAGDGDPVRLTTTLVSGDFFSTLGISPFRGRFFRVEDEQAGTDNVAVISHALWQDRFGADPSVVGRIIDVDGVPRTVVGIAPRGFAFPDNATKLWIPIEMRADPPGPFWGLYGYRIIARLRSEVTHAQATTDVARIAEHLQQTNPVWTPAPGYLDGLVVRDLKASYVSTSRELLIVLLGAVGLILLITCANVANLLMVRGAARREEFAVRRALGARSGRLLRQLVAESLLLAGLGGALGVVVAWLGLGAARALLPSTTPRLESIQLDVSTLLFALTLTAFAAIIFGLGPARSLAQSDRVLLAGARAGATAGQRRFTQALVVAQIAIGIVLVVSATLFVRSLVRIMSTPTGFSSDSVVTARLSPPSARYRTPELMRDLAARTLERLAQTSPVANVAITSQLPFDQTTDGMAMWVDGWTTDANRLEMFEIRRVSPEFFGTLGIPLRGGRLFAAGDNATTAPVAIINEAAAKKYWSGRSPVGGQVRFPWPGWLSVVGVVGDVRNNDLREATAPTLYLPFAQSPKFPATLVLRSELSSASSIAMLRSAVSAVARDVPISDESALSALVERSANTERVLAWVVLAFSMLALALSCIGTYGLIAYGVEARRREFAVRLALGASARSVIRLVVGEGMRLAIVGSVIGTLVALVTGRAIQSLLFTVSPFDSVSLIVAPVLLLATAIAAATVPAWRALHVEPSTTLRGG